MKKILSILLTVTMIFSLVAAFRMPTASAAVGYTFAKSTSTVKYYQRPGDLVFNLMDDWTPGTIAGTRVYEMGDYITITVKELPIGNVRLEIYDINGVATGSYTETYNPVLNNTLVFNVPTANVQADGPYYIRITHQDGVLDTDIFYIKYRLTEPTVNIPFCIGAQASVQGYVTRAAGYPLTRNLYVWIVDGVQNKLVAVNLIPAGQPAGQYFLTWTVQSTGDYFLGISDIYPSVASGYDRDGMIYKSYNNIPDGYGITVDTYIKPELLYKDQVGQPVLLYVKDSMGEYVTGLLQADWTITNATVTDYDEVSPGFYRFVITPVAGKVDVRFTATYTTFGAHPYSATKIINLRDKTLFNPYVDVTASNPITGYPWWYCDIATYVYDKLPCEIGFSLEIYPGFWDPIGDAIIHDSGFEVTGPVYEVDLGDGLVKYYVYNGGEIKIKFEAVIWKAVNEECEIDKYNACCEVMTKEVIICEVKTCPPVTPELADETTEIEVGKETDLRFSVSPEAGPEDLECGCDWKIYLMYMVNANCGIIDDAFTVKTLYGTTRDVGILVYNAVYDKWYSIGGYWLGYRTRIPGLYTYLNTDIFPAGVPDYYIYDNCAMVEIKGITFNYSNVTVCGNHLVTKLFGSKLEKDACGADWVHPLTYVGIDDITIYPSTTNLEAEATIWEGAGDDPDEILAGLSTVIDITDPGFSLGEDDWSGPIYWSFYLNDKRLPKLGLLDPSVSPLPDGGFRFSGICLDTEGTFKIVGTLYNDDCTAMEVLTLEFSVKVPTFTVKIGLMDGSVIDNDNIITEGFTEIIYVTPEDPRESGSHDFSGDVWNLYVTEVLTDCDIATSKVCGTPVAGQCCYTSGAIAVTGYDSPCVDEEPQFYLFFVSSCGAYIYVDTFKFVPPTVKVDPAEVNVSQYERSHITFTVTDAHEHGAPNVPVFVDNGVYDIDAGSTNKNGEVDWFVLLNSGRYYVGIGESSFCPLPCGWPGAMTDTYFDVFYKAPEVDTTAPVVDVDATVPAEVTSPVVTVTGKVTDDVGVVSLWIGAMKVDFAPDGAFNAKVEVAEGENTIKVVAFDAAGNKGEKVLTVTYTAPKVTVVEVQIGSDIMTVDGNAVQIDAPAEIVNGRTFLPLRAISEALGATVEWIPDTQGVTVTLGEYTIGLQIGNTSAVVNGVVMTLDAAPYIKNDRTMVPFRLIAEGLGATVEWDPALRIVTVTLAQ